MPLTTLPGATVRTLVVIGTAPHRLIVDPGVARCECGRYEAHWPSPLPKDYARDMVMIHAQHAAGLTGSER
jgi:hypothetical protein